MFGLPDPFADWLTHKLEEEVLFALFSAWMSAIVTFLYTSKIGKWLGTKDTATAIYMSLQPSVEKKVLALAVPKDMLAQMMSADNRARFETEAKD